MTAIPYLDEAWQPATGCSPCSPGCENCYAATMAASPRLRNHRWYKGLATSSRPAPGWTLGKWTSEVRCNEDALEKPLRWKTPRTIGVSFMGDLFHPDVPFDFLDKVFAVMALCQQHTFVLCTKRAERMREYLTGPVRPETWPLPNVHLGVTVESREQWTRMAILQATPADHRWISYEPALGCLRPSDRRPDEWTGPSVFPLDGISGIVVGCESGPNRRPSDLSWPRQIRDDCEAAGVKLYVKQLIVDGKFTKDATEFPEDLQIQDLSWPIGKRGA